MHKKFKGWTIPGPQILHPDYPANTPIGHSTSSQTSGQSWLCEEIMSKRISKDALSGHFRIFQYQKGHRYSTDDLLVAWYAAQQAPGVSRCLDLGSGIGSVAQVTAWKLPNTKWYTVEAQEMSVKLSPHSIAANDLTARFRVFQGDLRESPDTWIEVPLPGQGEQPPADFASGFELITTSPPYFPLGTGITADHSQKAECRFEIRGDVTDYLKRAATLLAPAGIMAGIFPFIQRHRVLECLPQLDLICLKARPVVFKEGEAPLMWLFIVGAKQDYPEGLVAPGAVLFEEPPLVIRTHDNKISPEYQTVKLSIGFGP